MANMTRRMITKRIGDVLLERGVITRKQFDEALAYQIQHGGLMGQLLIQLGFATEEGVALVLTAQYGFPYLPLDNYEIDEGLTQIIPEQAARTPCTCGSTMPATSPGSERWAARTMTSRGGSCP